MGEVDLACALAGLPERKEPRMNIGTKIEVVEIEPVESPVPEPVEPERELIDA